MKISNVIQGSADWLELRRGKLTASRIAAAMSRLKDGSESADRRNLKKRMVAEMLTEQVSSQYVSPAMEYGTETEPLARTEYEMKTGNDVRLVGFVFHPTIERCGCSPDGCIGEAGLFEAKCPETTTHIDYLLGGVVPKEYIPQIQFQLACTERDWVDFVSFDNRLPAKHRLFVKRMQRDDALIKKINEEALMFLAEVDEVIERLELGDSFVSERLRESIAVVQR